MHKHVTHVRSPHIIHTKCTQCAVAILAQECLCLFPPARPVADTGCGWCVELGPCTCVAARLTEVGEAEDTGPGFLS